MVLADHYFSKEAGGGGWGVSNLQKHSGTTKTAKKKCKGSHGIKIEEVLSNIIILTSDVNKILTQTIAKFHAEIASTQKKNRVTDGI